MTNRNLSVELRPTRLSEMVGQDALVTKIREYFGKGNTPIGVLLTGSFGAGKTTLARILGLSLNCEEQTQFGEPSAECLENADLFNIIERNCADLTTIDAMRELLPMLQVYPSYGKYRIIILDEFQQVSDKGQQVLLKPLEDKDSHTIFFFCTSDPTKINQAIKDRCVPFAIPELNPDDVASLIHSTITKVYGPGQESSDVPSFIQAVQTAQIRSPRNVVMATELYLAGAPIHEAIVIKEAGPIDYYNLFRIISTGDWDNARAILANAKPADGDALKMRLSAYFRDHLVKTGPGTRGDMLSIFIRELVSNNAVESGLQLSATFATIYRICRMIKYSIQNDGKLPPSTLV